MWTPYWINLHWLPYYMGMAMRKGTRNYASLIFGLAHKLAWHISWLGIQAGVAYKLACAKSKLSSLDSKSVSLQCWGTFWVSLLASCHGKGNLTLGIFICVGKADIMFNLVNWLTFGFFYAVFHCLVVAKIYLGLGCTYTIGFGLVKQNTTAILHWNSAKICMHRPISCWVELSPLAA